MKPIPVPFEENPTAVPRILTEEERYDAARNREEDDKRKAEEGIAKFKIELLFTSQFSIIKPVQGVMSFWESGSQLHGGGDSLIHFCPGKMRGKNDCEHYIPDPAHGFGFLVCPSCKSVWQGRDVFGQVMARLTSQKWAELICTYYRKLDMNCDVVIKYHREDIRAAMRRRFVDEPLADVRSAPKRLKRIYLMKSLIQDLASGSTLYDRMLAFVRA